jgi:predicted aspartyl protease
MGTFSIVMEVGPPTGERFVPFRGLVDTGSTLTALPESLLRSLGIAPDRRAGFELGDDRVVEYGIGHAVIRYGEHSVGNPVAFIPDGAEPVIGAVTLESFALVVDPVNGRLLPVNFLRR